MHSRYGNFKIVNCLNLNANKLNVRNNVLRLNKLTDVAFNTPVQIMYYQANKIYNH